MNKTFIESHMEEETVDDEQNTIVSSVDASNAFYIDDSYGGNELEEEGYLQATLEATQTTVIELKRQLDAQKKASIEDRTQSQKELQKAMEHLAIETAKSRSSNEAYENLIKESKKSSSENAEIIRQLLAKDEKNQKCIDTPVLESSADKDLIKNLRETQEQISKNTAEFKEKSRLIDDEITRLRDQLARRTPDITLNKRMNELKTLESKSVIYLQKVTDLLKYPIKIMRIIAKTTNLLLLQK